MEIQWKYDGDTMEIQWRYDGDAMEMRWKYIGHTIVVWVLDFGFWSLGFLGFCFLARIVFVFLILNHKLHPFNNIKY